MLMLESCDYSLKDWCDSQRFEVATGADYILECLRCVCGVVRLTQAHICNHGLTIGKWVLQWTQHSGQSRPASLPN